MTTSTLVRTPVTPELVHGALELEPTPRGLLPHRLDARGRAQNTDPQLAVAEAQSAGVRLVLRTAARVLVLESVPTKRSYGGAPPRAGGVHDLLVDGVLHAQGTVPGGDVLHVDLATGPGATTPGEPGQVRFDLPGDGEHRVELWLPHDEATVLVALHADAPVHPVPPGGPRWVHHGSSISQGSNAASPTATWPAVAARAAGVDLLNLGYGGGALLDPFTARALRDTPADLLSLELGINLVNTDLLRLRALGPAVHGFLDTIREGHPTTPLVVVSPLWCPLHETTPGPLGFDTAAMAEGRVAFVATGDPADPTRLTLTTVRAELARVVAERAATDPHLHLLDGRVLHGPDDEDERPLPDGLHPDTATHRVVGERFARRVLGSLRAGAAVE